jgi:Xaa-Pro aminopeptidase
MITKKEYKQRRKHLMKMLPAHSIAIIPGANEQIRSADVHYPFRQESHFLYLTGFSEPNAVLVLVNGQSILFSEPCDPLKTLWTGPVLGQEQALEVLGVEQAYPIAEFQVQLSKLLKGMGSIYYPFLQVGKWEEKLFSAWKKSRSQAREESVLESAFHDIHPLIAGMRLWKSPDEVELIQKAVDLSVEAHIAVMQQVKFCQYEYELAAIFQNHLQKNACMDLAYPSIIASGDNACILHYTKCHRRFDESDLLLIDAGGEWQGYAADLTRTYPVRGRWSLEQQAIYELVLDAQVAAINIISRDTVWNDIQTTIITILTQGLKDLGILKGSFEGLLEQQAYKPFYMHSSGHWLGLDVHDVGPYREQGESISLRPGMVLTVEPGLYLPNHSAIDPKWHGIGVRIEDDILVTSDGAYVFSHRLPKHIADLKSIGL